MKISYLQKDQTVWCRTGRAGRAAAEYGPWREASIYVQRDAKGQVILVTLRDGSTAEFRPGDFDPAHKEFCFDDHYLQIEGLES